MFKTFDYKLILPEKHAWIIYKTSCFLNLSFSCLLAALLRGLSISFGLHRALSRLPRSCASLLRWITTLITEVVDLADMTFWSIEEKQELFEICLPFNLVIIESSAMIGWIYRT